MVGPANSVGDHQGMEALVLVKETGKTEEIAAMMLDVMWRNGKEEIFIKISYILCARY